MSLLNIGLQNVSLARDKIPDQFKLIVKRLTTLKATRDAANRNHELKNVLETCMKKPVQTVCDIFSRLKWTGNNVAVHQPGSDEAFEDLLSLFNLVDAATDIGSFPPESDKLKNWLESHTQKRHYTFQVYCHFF